MYQLKKPNLDTYLLCFILEISVMKNTYVDACKQIQKDLNYCKCFPLLVYLRGISIRKLHVRACNTALEKRPKQLFVSMYFKASSLTFLCSTFSIIHEPIMRSNVAENKRFFVSPLLDYCLHRRTMR